MRLDKATCARKNISTTTGLWQYLRRMMISPKEINAEPMLAWPFESREFSLCDNDATLHRRRSIGQPTGSLQLGVFGLGLAKDRDGGVGVFPERKERLVSSLCPCPVSRRSERPAELQACHYSHG